MCRFSNNTCISTKHCRLSVVQEGSATRKVGVSSAHAAYFGFWMCSLLPPPRDKPPPAVVPFEFGAKQPESLVDEYID